MTRQDKPLPGSDTHPAKRVERAAGLLYILAGINIVFGILTTIFSVSWFAFFSTGPESIAVGVVYALLGYFAKSHHSVIALGLGTVGYALDGILIIAASLTAGAPVSGLAGGSVVRVFFLYILVIGLRSAIQLKREAPRQKTTSDAQPLPTISDEPNPRVMWARLGIIGLFVVVGVATIVVFALRGNPVVPTPAATSVAELEAVMGTNVAANKVVIDRQGGITYRDWGNADDAADFNSTTSYPAPGRWGHRTNEAGGTYQVVDLSQPYPLTGVGYSLDWDGSYKNSLTFKVEVSNDLETWAVVLDTVHVYGESEGTNRLDVNTPITPTEARYVKYWMPPDGDWNGWGTFFQLRAFTTGTAQIAVQPTADDSQPRATLPPTWTPISPTIAPATATETPPTFPAVRFSGAGLRR